MTQFVGFSILDAINPSFLKRFSKFLCLNISTDSGKVEKINLILAKYYTNILWSLLMSKQGQFSEH